MTGVQSGRFEAADAREQLGRLTMERVELGGYAAVRRTLQPGCRWSEEAGEAQCQQWHVGVVMSGVLRVEHSDGTVGEVGPGEVYKVEPGHDGLVVSDEPFVGVEFELRD